MAAVWPLSSPGGSSGSRWGAPERVKTEHIASSTASLARQRKPFTPDRTTVRPLTLSARPAALHWAALIGGTLACVALFRLVGLPAAVSVAGATALQQRLQTRTIELSFAAFMLAVAVWLFVK